tara:strand:+ start:1707 stop:1847 length:141 start_codon:yes stop_codon:yes gene_type:complete
MAQYTNPIIEIARNNKQHEGLAGAGNVLVLSREFLTLFKAGGEGLR